LKHYKIQFNETEIFPDTDRFSPMARRKSINRKKISNVFISAQNKSKKNLSDDSFFEIQTHL